MQVLCTTASGSRRAARMERGFRHAIQSAVELLESRTLLSAVSWTGGGDGVHWADANNWSGHAVPGTSDDVTISAGASTVVQVNTGTQSVNSLMSSNQILLNGGTLNLAAASQVTQLNFTSGALGGTGNFTVTGTLNWSGGTMSGTGTTIIPAAGSLSVASGDVFLERTVQVDGTATQSGGRLRFTNGTINVNGTFTTAPATNATLDNFGDTGTNNAINISSTGSLINNGPGIAQFRVLNTGIAVNNAGAVSVQQGTLGLDSGGTQTGSFAIAAASTLGLSGTHNFMAAASFSGPGTITLLGGTSTFAGALNFPGALQINNTGEADLNAASSVGPLKLNVGGALGGSGTASFAGASTWGGGTMSGSGTTVFPAASTLTIPASDCFVERTVQVDGTATQSGGRLRFTNGTINVNGTFTTTPSTGETLDNFGDTGTGNAINIRSGGSLINNGPGIAQFRVLNTGIAVNNAGSVSVQQGTLGLDSGGTQTGSFAIAAGATLGLSGAHSFMAASTFSGPGTITVLGGISTFAGALNFPGALQINNTGEADLNAASSVGPLKLNGGGALGGSGAVSFAGDSTWSGGTMSGSGTTIIPAAATLAIPTGDCFLQRVVRIDGSATQSGGRLRFSNGTINVNGTFTTAPATNATLDNFGDTGTNNAINVSSTGSLINNGPGLAQFRVLNTGVAVNNAGAVSVQQGTLALDSGGTQTGSFAVAAASTLALAGTHNFMAAATFSGPGTITVLGGISTFAGAVNFPGTLQINNTGEADFNAASTLGPLKLNNGGALGGSGTVSFAGASTWGGGTMSGSGTTIFPAAATLSIPTGDCFVQRVVRIDGTATQSGGRLRFSNGTINVNGTFTTTPATGATLDNFGDAGTNNAINVSSTGSLINNGPGLAQFRVLNTGVAVNNAGAVSVQQGTLALDSGGTQTGSFAIAAASTLALAGPHNFMAAATFSGPGTITVLGGTSTFGGAVNFPGALQINNTGEADLNAASTIGSLMLNNGGALGGSGAVSFTGASTWSGGAMSGSGTTIIPAAATLSIPTGDCFVQRVVRIDGTATQSGGRLRFSNGTINVNGTFTTTPSTGETLDNFGDAGTNNAINVASGGSLINNGPGTAQFRVLNTGVAVNNSGSVSVQQGTLALDSGGTQTGSFAVAAASTLGLAGTHAVSASSSFSGAGTINILGGTTTFAGLLNFTSGSLQLTNPGTAVIAGAGTSMLSSLSIGAGAKLDLQTSSLRISYGTGADPVTSVRTWLKNGQLIGTGSPALGYGDSAHGVVAGLPANTILIKPALPGDLNLDGVVNFSDLLKLAQDYGQTNDYWDQGDFNYDGSVVFADLLALAQNYGKTFTPAAVLSGAGSATAAAAADDPLLARRRGAHAA